MKEARTGPVYHRPGAWHRPARCPAGRRTVNAKLSGDRRGEVFAIAAATIQGVAPELPLFVGVGPPVSNDAGLNPLNDGATVAERPRGAELGLEDVGVTLEESYTGPQAEPKLPLAEQREVERGEVEPGPARAGQERGLLGRPLEAEPGPDHRVTGSWR